MAKITKQLTFVERYTRLTKRRTKLDSEFAALKQDARIGDCGHELAYETKKANDDGYGRWWYAVYNYCPICQNEERLRTEEYR